MRKSILKSHLTSAELLIRMNASKEKGQFQRWQVIYLTSKGLNSHQVSEYVGVSAGTVHQWVFRYNQQGPESMVLEGRGGRRFGLLTLEEEEALLNQLRKQAEAGEVVAAFVIRELVEKKVGNPVSKDYLYDLLHRHQWRKIMPRPEHPKTDKGQQEEFKKNCRNWWRPPSKNSTPRTPGR